MKVALYLTCSCLIGVSMVNDALASTGAVAQQTSVAPVPADKSPSADDKVEEVTVIGKRDGSNTKIDRSVYGAEETGIDKAGVVLDALRRIPGVVVGPDGEVSLRGNNSVQITIDGKVSRDREIILKSLSSTEIEQIEVMTNPTAQYSPEGGGGIINIVLKKKRPVGLSGGLTLGVDSKASSDASMTANFTQGKWNLETGFSYADLHRDLKSNAHFETLDRSSGSYSAYDRIQRADLITTGDVGNLKLKYAPLEGKVISFSVNGSNGHNRNAFYTSLLGADDSASFTENSVGKVNSSSLSGDFSYEQRNPSTGASLNIIASASRSDGRGASQTDGTYLTGAAYQITSTGYSKNKSFSAKLDREIPFGPAGRLSYGTSFSKLDIYASNILGISDEADQSYDNYFSGSQTIISAYSTMQFALGAWSAIPGLRIEHVERVLGGRSGSLTRNSTEYYPTFHIARNLSDGSKFRFSYSTRIDRFELQQLDPAITVQSKGLRSQGNPDLKNRMIYTLDGLYEANHNGTFYTATVYLKRTTNFSSRIVKDVSDGFLQTREENIGTAEQLGTSLNVRGQAKILSNNSWSYFANLNIFHLKVPKIDGPGSQSNRSLSWSANAVLSYDFRTAPREGNQLQVSFNRVASQLTGQGETIGISRMDISYRKKFLEKTYLGLSVVDVFDTGGFESYMNTTELRSQFKSHPSTRAVKLTLIHQW